MRPPQEVRLPAILTAALDCGQTVLAANRCAARTLQRGFDLAMHAAGKRRWQPAAILTLDAWAAGLWHRMSLDGTATAILLNRTQEHALWRAIVASDKDTPGLSSPDALAEMAAEAWSLLGRYNGRARLRELAVSADTAAFQRWALAFERRCRKDDLLSQAQLWERLEAAATAGDLPVPESGLLLVGFDRLVPAVASLFETLRRAGFALDDLPHPAIDQERFLFEATDERDEMLAAGRWARQRLEANSGARIAIVFPQMVAQKLPLSRILRSALSPDLLDIAAEAEPPFEFSFGQPLASTALVTVALQLIRWTMEPLQLEQITTLLLSPFLVDGDTLAAFDAFRLRRTALLRPEVPLDRLIQTVGPPPQLLARLRALRRSASEAGIGGPDRSHGEWAEGFRSTLRDSGWPGPNPLDSTSFQILRRWENALDELATLDFDGARVSAAQALEAVKRITAQTVFAPESRDAPVQVLGPLEAAGQTFDGVWFLGASDLGWPPPPQTSPLLPWQIQRELGMPGADAASDSRLGAQILARIAGAAQEVVFSYAARTADGVQSACPLLGELSLESIVFPTEERHAAAAFESFADDADLPPLPDRVHRGGAAILQAQAACGFKAFSEHRLWSTPLESAELGLDARVRGSIVHDTMEAFWRTVQDQATLKTMTTEARESALDDAIRATLAKIAKEIAATSAWDHAYMQTQADRLRHLLRPWLRLEMTRPEFAVRDRELRLDDVAVGPLRLNVRVDRVDTTAGGDLIVDYKTGAAKPSDWFSGRPDAPQLPLYSIVSKKRPSGVAFALLRAGEDLGLAGLASDHRVLAKSAKFEDDVETLEEQIDLWRTRLTRLAEDFCSGHARVDPKRYPLTCTYCPQRLLCRLDPRALDAQDNDGDAAGVDRG